jgi:nucleotide-binding universal stress UspA family protein
MAAVQVGRSVLVMSTPLTRESSPTKGRTIMFNKVIVGDDGLAGGRDALALARALAPDAELVIASTYPWDSTASRFVQLGYGNALRDDTEIALRHTRDTGGVPDARIVAIADTSPAHGLHELAETEDADLLVIGSSHHHGKVGRMMLGDVSRAALHGSPCPVAVAPHGFSTTHLSTIGVACDNEPEARLALKVAAEVAESLGARLIVNDVVNSEILPTYFGYPAIVDYDEINEELRKSAEARLEESCAGLPGEVDATVVTGPVAMKLDELAGKVDLMVCGSRGWGRVKRVVLGSTADRLIHSAPCPVLVVPRTADVAEPAAPAQSHAGA